MRTPDVDRIHNSFLRSLNSVESRFNRIRRSIRYRGNRKIIAWAAEMSLVSAVSLWEHYLIELLVAQVCTNGRRFISELSLSENTPVTRSLVEAVLIGLRYLDIRSYQDIKNLANRFTVGNPFGRLNNNLANKLDAICTIRNHIVHYSKQSKMKYQQVLNQNRIRRIQKPGFYLLVNERNDTRLHSQFNNIRHASRLLRG